MGVRFEPSRVLGRTGARVTRVGTGDLADRNVPLETCVATLRRALDTGINVVDTAPNYEDGYSEQIVGEALKHYPRQSVFLIDKIDHFDRPGDEQVNASLSRLGLEQVDVFALHNLSTVDGWNKAAASGGLFDQLEECRKAGKLRFRGISSHDPDTLVAAIESGLCDVVMFPIGPFVHPRYLDEILPLAKSRGVGTVCFKTFGAGKLLGDTEGYQRPLAERPRGKISSGGSDDAAPTLPRLGVEECVQYTLSADPDVALLGMSFPNEQDAALAAAAAFERPMTVEQMSDLRRRAQAAIRGKGPCWWNPDPAAGTL
jgi:aryl-alcohol dehydrogenase-like predicted oxidoreductase